VTTVLVGLTWATEYKKLLNHVRHRVGDEPILQELFNVAVETCHEEIGRRDFTDPAIPTQEWIAGMGLSDAPADEVLAAAAIPAPVRYGVWEYVRVAYHLRYTLPGVISDQNGAGGTGLTQHAANDPSYRPLAVARGHWRRYLLDATLSGAIPA
jgi:hypothetical protein